MGNGGRSSEIEGFVAPQSEGGAASAVAARVLAAGAAGSVGVLAASAVGAAGAAAAGALAVTMGVGRVDPAYR